MDGDKRRESIMMILQQADKPINGTQLSKELGVSRQVIVQDVALLRVTNKNIISTNRGYILYDPAKAIQRPKRVLCVRHEKEDLKTELSTIVDLGGTVLDVFVEHEIYGQIRADLLLESKKDVNDFLEKLKNDNTQPLYTLTDGAHYHTIEGRSEDILDLIEAELFKLNYLIKE